MPPRTLPRRPRHRLENGVRGNLLGGIGSGFAYAGGTTFLALPDRGPNANTYNPFVNDTVSCIARFDPESIRASNDGRSVFISDEYGPCVCQFDRATGWRIRSFALPANLAITNLGPQKEVEITDNTVGRATNKGMEGLALTPDGRTLVGIMQGNLEQDKKKSLRIVTIDTRGGDTHEYAYKLTGGSGVSDIVAVSNTRFLVDERDGDGFADTPLLTDTASAAGVKELFLIDLTGAVDVTNLSGDHSAYAVGKTLFLDIVARLNAAGVDSHLIPSKLEGVAFGQDVVINGLTRHTLYVANDNDFLATAADPLKLPGDATRGLIANPSQFYVFAFADGELPGYVPQRFRWPHDGDDRDCTDWH